MASQGPNNGSTFIGNGTESGGDKSWTNPSNAQTSNNSYATVALAATPNNNSYALRATAFGFSIPAGSPILGILVEVERKAGASNALNDLYVTLRTAAGNPGNNKASATYWPTGDAYASYGGAADTWGAGLTADDINNTAFGVSFAAKRPGAGADSTASVDHIRITVTYDATATIAATLVSAPLVALGLTLFLTMAATLVSVVTFLLRLTITQQLAATLVSIPTVLFRFFLSLAGVLASVPNLVAVRSFFRTIAATLVSIPIMTASASQTITLTMITTLVARVEALKRISQDRQARWGPRFLIRMDWP